MVRAMLYMVGTEKATEYLLVKDTYHTEDSAKDTVFHTGRACPSHMEATDSTTVSHMAKDMISPMEYHLEKVTTFLMEYPSEKDMISPMVRVFTEEAMEPHILSPMGKVTGRVDTASHTEKDMTSRMAVVMVKDLMVLMDTVPQKV